MKFQPWIFGLFYYCLKMIFDHIRKSWKVSALNFDPGWAKGFLSQSGSVGICFHDPDCGEHPRLNAW